MHNNFPKLVAQFQFPFVQQNIEELRGTKQLDMVVVDVDPVASDNFWVSQIKKANPDLLVYCYFSPGDTLTFGDDPNSNPVIAEYRANLKCDYLVKDNFGSLVPLYYNSANSASYLVNTTLPEVQDLQVYVLTKHLKDAGIHGIFLDWASPISFLNTALTPSGAKRFPGQIDINNDGLPESNQFVEAAWAKGHAELTRKLRSAGFDVIGNGGWESSLSFTHLSAMMVENFLDANALPGKWASWSSIARQVTTYNRLKANSQFSPCNFLMGNRANDSDPLNIQFLRYTLISSLIFGCGAALQNQHNYTRRFSVDEMCVDRVSGRATDNAEDKNYLGQPLFHSAVSVQGSLVGQMLDRVCWNFSDLAPIEDNIWMMPFQHGIALINPSNTSKSYALDRTYRKIVGQIDPATNNGGTANTVVIGPKNGIVLLR